MRPLIYQLFTGRNSFANIREHEGRVFTLLSQVDWTALKGFNTVYLLGVWDNTSEIVVSEENGVDLSNTPNRVPSVFAITDHTEPNPRLGSENTLRFLIDTLHKHGLTVIADLVVNQTSRQHRWVKQKPEYYKQHEQGGKAGFSGDVLMLDLDNPDLGTEFLKVMHHMIELGFDGVRADMAHLAPLPFWAGLIQQVREIKPEFTFIAEAYSDSVFDWTVFDRLQQVGFDYQYHEFLYRNLKGCFFDGQPMEFVADHLNYFLTRGDLDTYIHYFRNHDDASAIPQELEVSGWSLLLSVLPGGSLTYMGSVTGKTMRLGHHYLELLEESNDELRHLPVWWTNLVSLAAALGPVAKRFWFERGLLQAEVTLNGNLAGRLVVNMTRETVELGEPVSLSEGLLFGTAPNGQLRPGQGELFFVL